ncbi:MAG TPA: GAF domain-containing sensor histidine kinase [Candidatus Nanopelagicales bacterium]|jgi:signal transduction histidine kinase|nr:GAF domain-containing sensor histidine kinase [Candidatus Nanopelagicales bacterium]
MPATRAPGWLVRWRRSVDPAELVPAVARIGVLVLCTLLYALQEANPAVASRLMMLVILAVLASIPLPVSRLSRFRPIAEAAAAAAIIGTTMPLPVVLLPYLMVAPLAAGLLSGAVAAVTATLVSLVVLTVTRLFVADVANRTELVETAQWVGLALATGLIGAWARSVARRASAVSDTYGTAHRLLTRLRDVARQLPNGLDEVTLAQQVLAGMKEDLDFDRAGLYSVSDGGVLVPLALAGTDRVPWTPTLQEGIWARAWATGTPHQQHRGLAEGQVGASAVLALRLGDRRIGLIGLERATEPWTSRELARAQASADDAALRIDTGALFSEVRALATVEERRRLAREIHDGIAQEIASLGYLVDDLAAHTEDVAVQSELGRLRDELTRVVTELRLSIFDLRTDVQPSTGLGAALSTYVRSVGTGSGLTVHLVLDESAHRLPIEAETELLRIAQESVTNARRHAQAKNLWVTARVDPPRAFLRIADDGGGLGSPRQDSYGLEIMRERATRLGGQLAVRGRVGGGTVVEVTLGPAGPLPAAPVPVETAQRPVWDDERTRWPAAADAVSARSTTDHSEPSTDRKA